ncbi:aromatic amino acid transaminase [Reinekea marinisedimentorum]|uniref:Aspartate aminotransferase n=1 Tax=Reinekea marinisedimentorum TaxID=230495 RepID=A0A4V2UJV1_9GAMM|nr:amino acid aminotransferase [Reinekea marinisedimentorum]TCS41628.1 aspartate aminotransferase [Reinekea marinisedimentorum]
MFETIPAKKGDSIVALMTEFANDPRTEKMDLGIGIYRNNLGETPIMKAVMEAQKILLETEPTKAYQGLVGDVEYTELMQHFLLGGTKAADRAATLHTPGASGALRAVADLIAATQPDATVWISNPSYVNHQPIMERAGLKVRSYPYLNPETKLVDETAMLAKIAELGKGDVLLLHGCCHNPSGADITLDAWQSIADLANKNGFLPFVDIAYQGLGDGLDEDAQGLHLLANQVPELLISTSCSKNFGLYRERTGAAMVVTSSRQQALNTRALMCELARGSYSMPPAHGAGVVKLILQDDALTTLWKQELKEMTARVTGLRSALVEEFQQKTQSNQFDYFAKHKGMFTLTGFDDEMLEKLKADFGIYIVKGGRINVAGLKEHEVPKLVDAVIRCQS